MIIQFILLLMIQKLTDLMTPSDSVQMRRSAQYRYVVKAWIGHYVPSKLSTLSVNTIWTLTLWFVVTSYVGISCELLNLSIPIMLSWHFPRCCKNPSRKLLMLRNEQNFQNLPCYPLCRFECLRFK